MQEENKKEIRTVKKTFWREHGPVALEILKWAFVIWLLMPLRGVFNGTLHITRVLAGIALFVIFAGKLLYDTLIMDILRQKRKSLKQDIFSFLGMILVISLFVGFLLAVVAFMLVRLVQNTGETQF